MSLKQIENIIPVLAVSDLERSIEFHRRVLGFTLEWNKPWAYEMTIADPDGNILWLGAEPRS